VVFRLEGIAWDSSSGFHFQICPITHKKFKTFLFFYIALQLKELLMELSTLV